MNSPVRRRQLSPIGFSMQPATRHWMEETVREVLMGAMDIIPPGSEPYVGWSAVLAERIVNAIETGDTDA